MHLSHFAAPADNQPGGQSHFCPNCGHSLSASDTFCPNCGYQLDESQSAPAQPTTPAPAATTQTTTTKPSLRERLRGGKNQSPASKKNRRKWTSIGVVVLLLIIFFAWGFHHYSRQVTLDRSITDIQKGQNMTNDFTSSSPDLKITKSSLLPINRYYSAHAGDLSSLKDQLAASGRSDNGNFSFRTNGRHMLFFPKYQIIVSPVYPTVTTNHTGNKITLDHKQIATATSDNYSKRLSALAPGQYHLQASGKVGKHNLVNSGDYHITSSKSYDLDLTTISANLNTVPGSDIYLNGKKIGTVDNSGTYRLKDEPWSSDMSVSAHYTSSAGKAVSNSVQLQKNDDGNNIDLKYPNLISNSDADDFYSNLFETVQAVANGNDDETDDNGDDMSDFFSEGSSGNFYNQLQKMASGYEDDDDIYGTDMTTSIAAIKPGPNGTSVVTFDVEYDFELEDTHHIQTLRDTANMKDTSHDSSANLNYEITSVSGSTTIKDTHRDEDDDY